MSALYKNRPVDMKRRVPPFTVPLVDLRTQSSLIREEVKEEIDEVMTRCDFILGNKVKTFEEAFREFCGVRYAAGVASGTDALLIALKSLGIGPGDEVITQANTFIATVLAVSHAGARPVLVDIDPRTYNIDTQRIEERITERTKALLPVHIYGRVAPMDELLDTATKHSIAVVEDACQSHGAWHYGRRGKKRTGSIGRIGAFSFYPGKNLGAYGDGGMVTTDDAGLFKKVCMLRDYGQTKKYHHALKGFNSRLDTMQAAVLSVKLRYLEGWNILRVSHARKYIELLKDVPEVVLPEIDETKPLSHVFHLFVVRVEERDRLFEFLKARSINAGIHYPVPCHLQEAFKGLGYGPGDFPVTEDYAKKVLSLPMYPELTDERIEYVAGVIREFYGR